MSKKGKISLSRKQIEFVTNITEIKDPTEAVDKFIGYMVEQNADPTDLVVYVNLMMDEWRKRYG